MEKGFQRSRREKEISSRIPILLAVIILIFSSSIWYYDYIDTRDRIIQESEIVSEVTAKEIRDRIIDHIELINSIMITEWVSTDNISDISDYNRYLEIVPGFFSYYQSYLAINYINTSDIISWVYPFEPNQRALNRSVITFADGKKNDAYIQAKETMQLSVTPVISLFQGVTGLASYLPIIFDNKLQGMFNVVFQIETLVEDIIDSVQRQNYDYHILEGDNIFYDSNSEFKGKDKFVVKNKIEFVNREWVLHTQPNSDLRFQASIYNNIEILIFGAIASIVSFAFSRFIVNQNNLLEENYKKKEELEKIMFQYQKMDDLGILAGGIAHDFNNLLMGLQGNFSLLTDIQLEILQNSNSSEPSLFQEMKEASLTIKDLLDRSVELTSQILSFSRQSIIDLEFIDMKTIIEDTLRIVTQSIDKRIVINKAFENVTMFIYGNSSKMSQIIMNVILNSIDAQPNGGTIDIDLRLSDIDTSRINLLDLDNSICFNQEKMLIIEIRDKGEGIIKQNLDKLFVPFFTTKTKSKKGTGLGLAIVYRSVRAMFGDIIIESTPNVGTSVNIALPIVTEDYLRKKNIKFQIIRSEELKEINIKSRNSKQISHVDKKEGIETTKKTKPNIMIVDDETSIRRILRIFLEEKNHLISDFENGTDAIKFYQDNSDFDLIILDVNLPGISGVEVQQKMREINPNQKILFITGYSEDSISTDPKDNIHILSKPFDKSKFLSKISEIFSS